MNASISSAEPQELKRYAELAGRIDTHLDEESVRLSGILGHFAARCTEYATGVGPHTAERLRSYARHCAPTDEWVRQVGHDFAFADSDNAGWNWVITLGGPVIRPAPLDGAVIGGTQFQIANDTAQQAIDDACSWVTQQADRYRCAIAAAKEPPPVCSVDATYQEPEKSFLDYILDFIFGDSDKIKELIQQLEAGFEKARQTLQREWEGFVDVVKTFTPDWIEDVVTAIYKISEQIGGFFVGFAEAAYETITGLVTLVVDVINIISGDEATRQKYLAIIEAFKADPIGTTKIILESMAEPIIEDWQAGRYGEAVGRVTFELLPAILTVFTGGATGAAYASKLGKTGKVVDAISDTGRVVGKVDDAGRVISKLDDAGRIVNKVDDVGTAVDKADDASRIVDKISNTGDAADDVSDTSKVANNRPTAAELREKRANTTASSGVPYDADGYPVFDSLYDFELPSNYISPDVTDGRQMRAATRALRDMLEEDPNMARKMGFSEEQLAAISRGDDRIPDFTWHHHQDGKTLQLVDRQLHSQTPHSGGREVTGGRP